MHMHMNMNMNMHVHMHVHTEAHAHDVHTVLNPLNSNSCLCTHLHALCTVS